MEKVVKKQVDDYVEEIRYCDDFVILMQHKDDAEKVLKALEVRLNKFGLELSKEKTRLIEFGRYARINAERKGKKPDTFDFLGFTHYCDLSRKDKFKVGRRTRKENFIAEIKEMNNWLRTVRNQQEVKEWWETLKSKLRGHYQYYGVSGNFHSIKRFYYLTHKLVFKWINRRSDRKSMDWKAFNEYIKKFPLPRPKLCNNFYTLNCKICQVMDNARTYSFGGIYSRLSRSRA